MAYSRASAAALFFNSSLYFVAAVDVYLVLGSLLARAAVPPCDWKYFVADSFPPTFIIRSWSHCHTIRLMCQPIVSCLSGCPTIEICGSDKGYVYPKVPVVRRAVKAEIYAKRDGRPGGVLRATIKAHLWQLMISATVIPQYQRR